MDSEAASGVDAEVNKDTWQSPVPETEDCICRICYGSEEEESFMTTCRCKGSLEKVHKSCLERWLGSSHRECCELCHFIYRLEKRLRYKKWQSIRVWLVEKMERSRILFGCTLFLSLMATIMYLCMSVSRACDNSDAYCYMSYLEGMMTMMASCLTGVFLTLLGKELWYQYSEWRNWWQHCFMVTIRPYTVNTCSTQTTERWKSSQSFSDAG